jgi:hypothetical protein
MPDHTLVAKTIVACALAVTISTIAMRGAYAQIGCPSGLNQECPAGNACVIHSIYSNGKPWYMCYQPLARGAACSADQECASGACGASASAPADPSGNNYHSGLCE